MSGDQRINESDELAQTLRDAEAAVDKVRSGQDQEDDEAIEAELGPDADDDEIASRVEAALAAEVAAARAEAESNKDKWLRAVADLDNYKKRTRREIDEAINRALQGLLGDFLPVGDNLERALSALGPEVDPQVRKGLEMVRHEFFNALGKHGIKPVETLGKPFDPNFHDALQQVDTPEHAPGIVMMEFEKGYVRGDRLLRPARVIVAGPGSTGKPPAGESGEA
jgi:molecular chaperone GrpE